MAIVNITVTNALLPTFVELKPSNATPAQVIGSQQTIIYSGIAVGNYTAMASHDPTQTTRSAPVAVNDDGAVVSVLLDMGLPLDGGGGTGGGTPDSGTGGSAPDSGGGGTPDSGSGGSTPDSGSGGGTPDSGSGGSTPDSGSGGGTPDSGTGGSTDGGTAA